MRLNPIVANICGFAQAAKRPPMGNDKTTEQIVAEIRKDVERIKADIKRLEKIVTEVQERKEAK